MLLKGEFKLTEAKSIFAKSEFGIDGYRLNPSCNTFGGGGGANEKSRHRWIFLRRSIGCHDDRPKCVGLHTAKRVG